MFGSQMLCLWTISVSDKIKEKSWHQQKVIMAFTEFANEPFYKIQVKETIGKGLSIFFCC